MVVLDCQQKWVACILNHLFTMEEQWKEKKIFNSKHVKVSNWYTKHNLVVNYRFKGILAMPRTSADHSTPKLSEPPGLELNILQFPFQIPTDWATAELRAKKGLRVEIVIKKRS